jgi:hypothetical protein
MVNLNENLGEVVMSMNRQSVSERSAPAPAGYAFFHFPWCVVWLLLEALGVLLASAQASPISTAAGVLLMLYAFQGLIAEILGVKVDSNSISAPRRLTSASPFFVIWRERIPLNELHEIISLSKFLGFERVRV